MDQSVFSTVDPKVNLIEGFLSLISILPDSFLYTSNNSNKLVNHRKMGITSFGANKCFIVSWNSWIVKRNLILESIRR